MAEQQNQVRRKLNVRALVAFISLYTAITLGAIIVGLFPANPVGYLAGLAFIGFFILIGLWAEWSGLAKYLGWDRG